MATARIGALALAAGLALASCGSSGGNPGSGSGTETGASAPATTSTPTPTESSTSTPTTPAGGARSGGAGSGGARSGAGTRASGATGHVPVPRAQACTGSALSVAVVPGLHGDQKHGGFLLTFTNRGAPACTLTGYPGLAAVSSSGAVLTNATRGRGGVLKTVFLTGGGGSATALASWSTVGPDGRSQCGSTANAIEVTPPNATATRTYHQSVGRCSLTIYPVQGR